MRPLPFMLILAAACTEYGVRTDPTNTVTVTEVVTETVTNTNTITVTEPGTEPETDPCDVTFRAYGENNAWIDVTVGAMPIITMTSDPVMNTLDGPVTTSFTITSHDNCGEADVNGVQVAIELVNGAHFPYDRYTGPTNEVDTMSGVWEAPTGWSGATNDPAMAYSLFVAWWDLGPSTELGDFAVERLAADGELTYTLDLDVMSTLPEGEYLVTHYVVWTDVETGTWVGPTTVEPGTSPDEEAVQTLVQCPG